MDVFEAERLTDELISAELAKQNQMWGRMNERADISQGQLFHAGIAQIDALFDRQNGEPDAFASPPEIYPQDWSGFRDYGSDIANLVVAVVLLHPGDQAQADRWRRLHPPLPRRRPGLPT